MVLRAPWTTSGYVKNREGSEALWRGGYLHTGDIGNLDADGYLRITDRLKDVIKSGGEWISSIELEGHRLAVRGRPPKRPPSASPTPDGANGPWCWWSRPTPAHRPRRRQSGRRFRRRRAQGESTGGRLPDRILFVESLEKTSVGKIDKKRLRARYSTA